MNIHIPVQCQAKSIHRKMEDVNESYLAKRGETRRFQHDKKIHLPLVLCEVSLGSNANKNSSL